MFNPMTIMPQIALLVGELTGKEEKARRLAGVLNAGAEIVSLVGAFKSPNIKTDNDNGLGISNYEDFKGAFTKNYGGFGGDTLPKGISEAFGMKIKLPESLGGAFKSPSWNAPASIFNPPGKTKPIPWFL